MPSRRWPKNQSCGLGRLEAREVEDADIDGGDRDARLLAGGQPGDLDGHGQHGAGLDLLGRVELHVERARRLVDGEPAQAERAGRHALGLLVHRPIEHDA